MGRPPQIFGQLRQGESLILITPQKHVRLVTRNDHSGWDSGFVAIYAVTKLQKRRLFATEPFEVDPGGEPN